MKVFAILSLALCHTMAFGNTESLLKAASQLTEHSVNPRQTNCDLSHLQNYPSDCLEAVNTFANSGTSGMIPAVLCEPRCGQPIVNFYITCGLDIVVPTFVQGCGTNAIGQRCGTGMVVMAINRTSMEISSNCAGTIAFGSNCTTDCQNTLTTARQSPGCCIQLLNTTAITPNFVTPAIDPQLWEERCGVDLLAACPSSLSPTITVATTDEDTVATTGEDTVATTDEDTVATTDEDTVATTDGSTALIISKTVLAVPVLLLGALVF